MNHWKVEKSVVVDRDNLVNLTTRNGIWRVYAIRGNKSFDDSWSSRDAAEDVFEMFITDFSNDRKLTKIVDID